MDTIKEDTLIFLSDINPIGGCEQWLYEIAKKYSKNHRITMLYKRADRKQLVRLSKLVKCIKYNEQQIECNTWIYCYDTSLTELVKAKEKILTIHADYVVQGLQIEIPPSTTKIYAVSEIAKKAFIDTHGEQMKRLGLHCDTLYNPIKIDEPKPILKLISPTRLTPEKGQKRMELLAERLAARNIPFIWLVFTNLPHISKTEGFIYLKPTLDILGFIKEADMLVQLSDTEGFAYTIVESLCLGTPVAVTNFPVAAEMGIEDGVNGYVFKMDMSNMDEKIDEMLEKKLKGFEYTPKHSEEEWDKILGKKQKPTYKYVESEMEKEIFLTETQQKDIFGRGFTSYNEVKDYMESQKFKKLSLLEQGEFKEWFVRL